MRQYDVVTNINLGKLLPENWGLQIPLNLNLGETFIRPEYDPFYQDIQLQDRLDASKRISQRDSINQQAIDYTKRKSISLIGVRKNKMGNKIKKKNQTANCFGCCCDFVCFESTAHHQHSRKKPKTPNP